MSFFMGTDLEKFCIPSFAENECRQSDGLMDWTLVDYCDVLSAVWTFILTAPIHCRGSIGKQGILCYISPNLFWWRNKLIYTVHAILGHLFILGRTMPLRQNKAFIQNNLHCIQSIHLSVQNSQCNSKGQSKSVIRSDQWFKKLEYGLFLISVILFHNSWKRRHWHQDQRWTKTTRLKESVSLHITPPALKETVPRLRWKFN